jgi:hypothetical protein
VFAASRVYQGALARVNVERQTWIDAALGGRLAIRRMRLSSRGPATLFPTLDVIGLIAIALVATSDTGSR